MRERFVTYTIDIHHDPDHGYAAAVVELPGCFASGFTLEELYECLEEGISLYLSEPDRAVQARLHTPWWRRRRALSLPKPKPTSERLRRRVELCA